MLIETKCEAPSPPAARRKPSRWRPISRRERGREGGRNERSDLDAGPGHPDDSIGGIFFHEQSLSANQAWPFCTLSLWVSHLPARSDGKVKSQCERRSCSRESPKLKTARRERLILFFAIERFLQHHFLRKHSAGPELALNQQGKIS